MKDLGDIRGWYDEYIEARDSRRVAADFREFDNIDANPLKSPVSVGVRTWNTIAQDDELVAIGKRAVGFWTLGRELHAEQYGQEKTDEEELITQKFFDFGNWVKWKNRLRGFGPLDFRRLVDVGAKDFDWMSVEGDKENAFREALLASNRFYEGEKRGRCPL